jgi:alcohol dehydrogenase
VVRHEGEFEMLGLLDRGVESRASEEVRDPTLKADTDALLRVDAVTPFGTDLHMHGDAVGTVEAVGPGVKTIEVGDRVLVSCITSGGADRFAELVRVPFADTSTCRVPDGLTDGQILMLATFFRRARRPTAVRAR